MKLAVKTIRHLIAFGLFASGVAACMAEAEPEETTVRSDDALLAVEPVECVPAEDEDSDAEACQNCGCDLVDATIACRALAACGGGATAEAVSGGTCSVNDCRTGAGCGGKIKCMKGGQECGSLPNDSGKCKFQ